MGKRKISSIFSCFTGRSSVRETPHAPGDTQSPPLATSDSLSTSQPCDSEDVHTPSIAQSHVASSSTSAAPSSPTPSASVPKERDHTKQIGEAAEKADLDVLSKHISRYLAFLKDGGEKPSPVSAAKCDWPDSKSLIKLKDLISGAAVIAKDICPDAKTIAQKFLQGMGGVHMLMVGFLVAGEIMERFETISSNKQECVRLLERMNSLIQYVNELRKRHGLKEAMEDTIKRAIELIIEVSLTCCTQINRPKWKKFLSTGVNTKELQGFQTRLTDLHSQIQSKMGIVQHDLLRRAPVCPQPSEEFRRENRVQIEKVTELVKSESEERAVAVILYGLGGTGKTALADAVYSSLYHGKMLQYRNHEEVLECKYSFIRLFEFIDSVPDIPSLQTQILKDLTSQIPEIRMFEGGRDKIKEILEREPVFIYIDNLCSDNVEGGLDAIERLLPRTTEKVMKLRLLITTRDKGAADKACNNLRIKAESYPIETLEDTKAMQLLKKELNDGEEDLVNEQLNGRDAKLDSNQINQIVQICGGIPKLLIKVAAYIGIWSDREEAQRRYLQVIWERENDWNGRVGWNNIARYAFAHEHLDEKFKDPFFDICSYFEGWRWEELSNIVGDFELNSLEDRALVTKDVTSMTAKVHTVILAIGIHNKGRRFKFNSASEFEEVLNEDLPGIKGIWSHDNIGSLDIPASKLDLMCGSLRVLALQNSTKVIGRCKRRFDELFFFSAQQIPDIPFDLSKVPKLRHKVYRPDNFHNLCQGSSTEERTEGNDNMEE